MKIPEQRTGAHDAPGVRLVLADSHTHAGQTVTIIQPCGSGFMVRIGNDVTRITPQYVAAEQIQEQR